MHRPSAAAVAIAASLVGHGFAVDPVFVSAAGSTGLSFTHATSGFALSDYAGGGCVGDFDNDGWQDVFVISGGGNATPDRVFINNGDGTFSDQSAAWGLTVAHKGKGCCVGDYDRDGWLDVFVTSAGPWGQNAAPGHHKLYRNNGDATFTNVAPAAGVATSNPAVQDGWGACFGDYDLDGDLDLFIGGFSTSTPNNAGNRLFRNNGDGTFTDITASIGLFAGVGPVACLGSAFVDTDGDRYPELLLSGDFKGAGTFVGSRYFRNNAGASFTDLTVAAHTGSEENGMGQCRGDLNNDGKVDWYVTSIYHPPFGWTGNKHYRNVGTHSFAEVGVAQGVQDGGYGWGTVAIDFNHDTWLDIAETNGDNQQGSPWWGEQSYLWMNSAGAGFAEKAVATGLVYNSKGRCLLNLDFDNDGDQDILIFTNKGALAVFRNDLAAGPSTGWLRLFLDTTGDATKAPNGFGAKVTANVGLKSYTRWIEGGSSFLGVSELSAHFGLGSATSVDSVVVAWPDGATTTLTDVAVNQTITIASIEAPPACSADLTGDDTVDGGDLGALLGAWGEAGGDADLNGDGTVDAADLGLMLAAWGECA